MTQGRMPYINLLPWRQTQQKARRRKCAFLIMISVLLIGGFCISANHWVDSKLRYYRHVKSTLVQNKNHLRSQLHLMQNSMSMDNVRSKLRYLIILINSLPLGMKFNYVAYSQHKIELSGIGKARLLENWVSDIKAKVNNARVELVDMQSHGGDLKWHLDIIWANKIAIE